MWTYDKRLQYPIKIKNPNAQYAKVIISQYGGPNGRPLQAALFNQKGRDQAGPSPQTI